MLRTGFQSVALAPALCAAAAIAPAPAPAQEGDRAADSAALLQDQDLDRARGVRDRERPEYDAAGWRVGGLRLYPAVEVAGEYNDNVYAVAAPAQRDVYFAVSPSLRILSDWSRHAVSAEVGASVEAYEDAKTENNTEYYARAGGRLDVSGDTAVKGALYYGRLVDSRSNNAFDDGNTTRLTAEPISYDLAAADIGASHVVNRVRFSAEAHIESQDFDDQPLIGGGVSDQDVRDRTITRYGGAAEWAMSPDTHLFVRGSTNRWDYDLAPPASPYDRDATGYRLAGGATFMLGDLAAGEVFMGYQEQSFDDPRLSGVKAVDYGASVSWYLSQLTTVRLDVESDIEPSTVDGASSVLRQDAGLTVDHELLRNVLIQTHAQYGRDEFDDITRTDEWISGSARVDYLVNRRVRLFTSFKYIDHASDVPVIDYDQKIVSVGARLQL